ncbi:MAG: RNA polymerase sigma factor [Candidatus Aminicenantes bacterium]|nr:MAG: RNA polymerase sigma factor [Candidatus Aminicenantes bacterium]
MLSSIVHPLRIALLQKDREINQIGSLYMEENRKKIWEKFYENYSRSFWFYIYKICGDEPMADDIFQESFYKFLKAKINFQNEKHMQAYLYRIAYRLIIDKARRIKVEKKAIEGEKRTYMSDNQKEGPKSEIHFSLDMEKTFKKLKPKERTLLWLVYVEGYSYGEIAEMTDTKENSLKVQLFRAREKLAKILKTQRLQGRE